MAGVACASTKEAFDAARPRHTMTINRLAVELDTMLFAELAMTTSDVLSMSGILNGPRMMPQMYF